MGKFSEAVAKAAPNVERIARALESMPQGGSFSGPGGAGGGGGGAATVPPVVFNTTVTMAPEPRRMSGGTGGGGGGGNGNGQTQDFQTRAFAYFGLSSAGKSSVFIAQIVKEFQRLLKNDSLSIRISGGA